MNISAFTSTNRAVDTDDEMFVTAFDHMAMTELVSMIENLGIGMTDYESNDNIYKYSMHASFDNDTNIIIEHNRDTKTSTISIIIRGMETIIRANEYGNVTTDIHDEHIRETMALVIGIDNDIESMATI